MKHAAWIAQTRIDSPLGPLTAVATPRGLAGLWFDGQAHHPGQLEAAIDPDQRWLALASEQLASYWRGARVFDLPLDPQGTPFQIAVWHALLSIAPGSTLSYREVASAAGQPRAVRAVGAAIARNPISIIVPCHRVVGAGGSLTGYAGGLDRKLRLLQLEGAQIGRPNDRATPGIDAGLRASESARLGESRRPRRERVAGPA